MQLVYTLAILPDGYSSEQALALRDSVGNYVKIETVVVLNICKTYAEANVLISNIYASISRLTDTSKLPRTCAAGSVDCFCAMNQPDMGRCKYSSTN